MAEQPYYDRINQILDQSRPELPEPPRRRFRRWRPGTWKRWLRIALLALVAVLIVAYAADAALAHYRIAGNHGAFGSVTIDRYSAIAEKANKTEFNYLGSENRTCLHSLFPQAGYTPCWWARRHTQQRIDY